ncbi:biopolymer transporter ExbD [candidate division KSB1 bacterium]|nr:biopolymer transporter ExbD [candidate division KSB1 bacterium]
MLLDKKRTREAVIPTSSMADIAFLLLTFFLVTTSLDMDKGLQLTLPPKGESRPIPKHNIASLMVNATGEVLLDEEEIPIANIKETIRLRLAQNDRLLVSIQTARETHYQVFVSVLDQVQMAFAGQPRISIAEPQS